MPFMDEKRLSRMFATKDAARKLQKPIREKRKEIFSQIVGKHYKGGQLSPDERVPLNLAEMFVQIMRQNLASRNPKVMVTQLQTFLKAQALDLEADLNQVIRENRMQATIDACVVDALVTMGIAKVAMNDFGGTVAGPGGKIINVVKPTVEAVSQNDWFHDPSATRWSRITICGDRWVLPLEDVQSSGIFDPEAVNRLQPVDRMSRERDDVYAWNDEAGQDRHYIPQVELWDVWDPRNRLVVTICDQVPNRAMRVTEWEGPEHGPYHRLAFGEIPDEIYPLAPILTLLDLHNLGNMLFNKGARQALRQKTNLLYRGQDVKDAERIATADDGEVVRCDNPETSREARYGGVDQVTLAFIIQIHNLFKEMGGNLDALGGFGPQSETLGQDQIIAQAASKRLSDMQDRTVEFTSDLVWALGELVYDDPLVDRSGMRPLPGTDIQVPYVIREDTLKGLRLRQMFELDPYSMRHSTPQQKLQTLSQMLTMIQGLAPQMQMQGIVPNVENIMRIAAKYTHFRELDNILTFAGSPQTQPDGDAHGVTKPPVTHRINERVNRPGATQQGKDQMMIQQLLGSGLQDSQKQSLTRPVG